MGLLKLLTPETGSTGNTLEKATTSQQDMPARTPKSWDLDPYSYVESLTHKERPSSLSYDHLRAMSMRCDVIAAILATRIAQVAEFARPQPDKYSMGYTIVMRDGSKPGSRAAQKMALELSQQVQACGIPGTAPHNLKGFLKQVTRDTLTFDQFTFEIVPRNNGLPAFVQAVDAATIRIAADPPSPTDQRGEKVTDLVPQTPYAQAMQAYQRDLMVKVGQEEVPAKYVQMINGTVRTRYAAEELYFGVRNPRTDINVQGYGFSELEQLINTVTSYLFAEEYNKRIFTQGSIPKGILNLKGEISDEQLAAFKREWVSLIAGVQNAWKTPIINAEDIDYVNLQSANKDMEYMQWIQFLVRIASAVYLIDPAEINFDMPRGLDATNPMIESGNEGKLRASRDRGLNPLLGSLEEALNDGYVYRIDPDFAFKFVGLGARTIDQEMATLEQQVTTFKTLNEVRAQEDLPPVPNGDIVLNPIYAQALLAAQQAEMQQQEMQQQAAVQEQQQDAEEEQADKQRDHEKDIAKIEAKADVESAKHQAKAMASKAKMSGGSKSPAKK